MLRFRPFRSHLSSPGFVALFALASLLAGGCIPYTMGTTAQPVPEGRPHPYSTLSFVPGGVETRYTSRDEDEETVAYPLPSAGVRFRLDDASDLGVRAPALYGIVFDYKRRVLGDSLGRSSAIALVGGGGVVHGGNHGFLEASVLVSGPERGRTLTPYGGLRAMHVLPLSDVAPSDHPTLGAFAGLRIGNDEIAISPEIGVFYDPPALELRDHDFIAVPGITAHGLLNLLDLIRIF